MPPTNPTPPPCRRCGQPHTACTAHRRDGNPCHQPPLKGIDKCRLHCGRSLTDVRQDQAARQAVATYGLPVEIDPHAALLEEVHRTAGHVRWLQQVVSGLDQSDLVRGLDTATQKAGGLVEVTARAGVSKWVRLYQDERKHLVAVSKAAIDAGIAERDIRLAEAYGQKIVEVIQAALDDAGVEVTEDVAASVSRHLRLVDGVA